MGSIPTRSRHFFRRRLLRTLRTGLIAAIAAVGLGLGEGIAQPDPPDEPVAVPDEVASDIPVDSTTVGRGKGFDAPVWVMMRSAVVPGWGQAHNGQWWKAIVVGGAQSAFLYGVVREDHLRWKAWDEGRYDDAQEHAALKRDYLWWGAFALLLSLGDAYVEAHLKGFDAEFREEDKAILLSFEVRR